MKFLFLFLIFIFLSFYSYSQNRDSIRAEEYFQRAETFKDQDYAKAASLYRKAANLFRGNSPGMYAESLIQVASTIRQLGDRTGSMEIVDSLLLKLPYDDSITPQVKTFTYNLKALLLTETGRREEADVFFEKAVQTHREKIGEEDQALSNIYTYRAIHRYNSSFYEGAKEDFLNALNIDVRLNVDSAAIARGYNNVAAMYLQLNDYYAALDYTQKGIEMKSALFGDRAHTLTYSYINLGNIYRFLHQYQVAETNFLRALQIRKAFNDTIPSIAIIYRSLANIHTEFLDPKVGISYADSAVSHYLRYGRSSRNIMDSYRQKARAITKYAKSTGKLDLLQQSEAVLKEAERYLSEPGSPSAAIEIAILRSENYLLLEDFTQGLKSVEKAMQINCPDTSAVSGKAHCYALGDVVRLLIQQSRILVEAIEKKGKNSDYTNELLATVRALDAYFDRQLFDIRDERSRESYFTDKKSTYTMIFKCFYQQQLWDQAYEVVKMAKAKQARYHALLLLLDQKQGNDLLAEKQLLDQQVQQMQLALLGQNDRALSDSLLLLYRQQEALLSEINMQLKPQDYLSGDISPDQNRLIIDYFDAYDTLYAMLVSADTMRFYPVPADEQYRETVEEVIPSQFGEKQQLKYRYLYKKLLGFLDQPEYRDYQYLTIVPDDELWSLNFDLLLTTDVVTQDVRKMPFLIKKYAIHYVAASGGQVLGQSSNAKKGVLAFSYDTLPDRGNTITMDLLRNTKGNLPGSKLEVKAIANQLDGDYLYGANANEKQFKEIAKEYQILHLAMHGEISPGYPETSYLSFYAGGDDLEDGKLYSAELQNLDLSAELAVLSACHTGSGKLVPGEGIRSIGTGFERAGVPSLLLTRWEIADVVAPEIMEVFYRELKKGVPKSEALRQAKIAFLENANSIAADPYYWSSFFIYGDDVPLEFNQQRSKWWYFLTVIGVLSFPAIVLYFKRNRDQSSGA